MRAPAALAALLLVACTSEPQRPGPPAGPNAVTVEAVDYDFRVSGSVRAGSARITFANAGTEWHVMALHRLKAPITDERLRDVIATKDQADDVEVFEENDVLVDGSQGLLGPGERLATYAEVRAGTYAIACYALASDRRQHYSRGMVGTFTVGEAAAPSPEPPVAGEIRVDDTSLTLPDLSSGKGTYRFVNTGKDFHSLMLVRLADGKGYRDFLAWSERMRQGKTSEAEFPGQMAGSLNTVDDEVLIELDLRPGRYLALDTELAKDVSGTSYFLDEYGGLRAEFTVS